MQAHWQTGLLAANGREKQASPGLRIWQAMLTYRSIPLLYTQAHNSLNMTDVHDSLSPFYVCALS